MENRRKFSTLVLLYFALFSVKLCVKLRFFNGEPHTLIVFCARQREIWKTLLVGLSHIDAASGFALKYKTGFGSALICKAMFESSQARQY